MAVTRKTINFLPDIFRSDVNRKFLGSTLDQLISEPNLRKINGFIGRKFSASVRATDNFILETSAQRQNYQLEPAVVTRDSKDNIDLTVTYPDLVNKINYYGGVTNDHNRLFDSEYYNFDPHIDLDKFVNFTNYRWINDPSALPLVTIGSLYPVQQSEIVFTKNGTSYITSVGCDNILFPANWNTLSEQEKIAWYNVNNITETTLLYNGYSSAEIADLRASGYTAANAGPTNQCLNPTILIVRNKEFKFTVNHAIGQGNLWIQTEPSVTGFKPYSNVSVRNIAGVSNNGISSGNILVNIPSSFSQINLLNLETVVVDLAIDSTFTLSDNATWANTTIYPDSKLVVFTSNSSNSLDWITRTGSTLTVDQRRGIYRARTVTYPDSSIKIEYAFVKNLSENVTVKVTSGKYKGFEFVRNAANLDVVPAITSPLNTLYYQNDVDNTVGQIRIIDNFPAINVLNDILGAPAYTSPNGVEFINGLRIRFDNTVNPAQYRLKEFVVEGVGKSITLLDLSLFKEVPPQTAYNNGIYQIKPDYITINRASMDYNTWSRSNQWIHVDVLNTIKRFNPGLFIDDMTTKAVRPIIEFEPDLQLYNHGRKLLDTVTMFFDKNSIFLDGSVFNDITTQLQGISFSRFSSLIGYNVNPGDTAIFNNDIDPAVRNKIYTLDYIDHSTASTFDLTLSGSVTGYKDRSYLISTNTSSATKFNEEVNVGDSLFASGNVFIGRVASVISSTQKLLDRKLSTDLLDVTGIAVKGSVINLKVKSNASLFHSVYVVGPDEFTGFRRKTVVNSRTMFHWDRKIYADPESYVPEVVYSWTRSQNKEHDNQEPLFDIITDNTATFLGTSNLNIPNLSLGEKLIYNNKKSVFSDPAAVYRDTEFIGTKLFSYQHGSSAVDPIIGFGLSYDSINGFVGDIKFVNNFDTDTFEYRGFNNGSLLSTTAPINRGYIRKNTGLGDTDCVKLTVWSTVGHNEPKPIRGLALTPTVNTSATRALAAEIYTIYINYLGRYPTQIELDNAITTELSGYSIQGSFALSSFETVIKNSLEAQAYKPFRYQVDYTNQMQHISHIYDGYTSYFDIDLAPRPTAPFPDVEPNIKLFINNHYVTPALGQAPIYSFQQLGIRNTIKIDPAYLEAGDRIDILVAAPPTNFGYYQIPQNLEFNSQNRDILNITHGQMRSHLERVAQNIQAVVGQPLGISNIYKFDLNNRGGTLLQHSAPVMYSALFLVDERANLLSSIDYARREYTRFKNKFLETVLTRKDITSDNIPDIVDNILYNLNKDKNPNDFAFFYSDMLAYGKTGDQVRLTVLNTANTVFDLQSMAPGDYYANLIYLNNRLLVKGLDYSISGFVLSLSSSLTIQINDIITIKMYKNTDGCYIPETPTKLGLYPKYLPGKFIDNTLGNSGVYVIQGHDGSLTIAFNDYRDDLLLELETRIYNNLKIDYDYDRFDIHGVIPGRYRRTDYSPAEYNRVINSEFLKWAGFNHLDYAANIEYSESNKFTYNYSRSQNELGQSLPGHWRGIYKFYYDTDRPHTHPWEMLGHSIKPGWWDTYYSWTEPLKRSALIIAITEGYTQSPALSGDPVVNLSFKRNGFSSMVPVDTSGNLIAPIDLMVRSNNSSTFNRNYVIGDHGPAETAWRRSSEYPFALQRAMSLLKPARYFALNIDITRYNKKSINDSRQFVLANNKRPSSIDFLLNGEIINEQVTRSASYINWIHGYLTNLGIEPIDYLKQKFKGLGVNLAHKLGGFSDKKYLNVFAEQFAPNSIAESVIIPDENYQIHLNKSVPTDRAVYSAVIIEKTSNGYSVTGYDQRYPYFTVIPSETAGSSYVIEVLNKKATVFTEFRSEKIIIPYGFEFDNEQQIVDFLVSYQRFLIAQGFIFDQYDPILQVPRDWILSAKEFMTWEMQGWDTGNVLVLSPVIDKLSITSNEGFVDEITNQLYQSRLLGANFNSIKRADFTLLRDGDVTTIKTISGQTIALADVNLVEYEHILIFDDITVFNDLVYNQTVGNRQFRMKLIGSKTNLWDGTLMPPGFVYTDKSSSDWITNKTYNKGDIVNYKNKLYTAIQKIEASDSFNLNYWKELDSIIESGIVPNFAQLASRSQEIYDIDNLPLDEEFIKFSGSLIGYRTRPYLTELGLNETSQIKFYQGYIRDKGTYRAIDGLARGDFDNINNDIEIFEEWGARIGVFGGIDANPEVSVPISDSLTVKNPMVFEFLDFKQQTENSQINPVYPNQLILRPYDYDTKLFLNRNEDNLSKLSRQAGAQENKFKLAKIEMFGDGVICGQEPTTLLAYTITAVENFNYDVDIYGQSSYAIRTLDQKDSLVFQPETINSKLTFDIGSLIDIEGLEYIIEPAGDNESQLSVSTLAETQINTLLPGQPFRIAIRSVQPIENLTLAIESPNTTDALNQNEIGTKLVSKVTAALNDSRKIFLRFSVSGVEDTENLFYTIEDYDEAEDTVLSSTFVEYGTACTPQNGTGAGALNRSANRVDFPPDILLYEELQNDISTSIITRSVGGSTSSDLLIGSDGANNRWPDDIEADIVIINHGLNDAKKNISVAVYKENLIGLRNGLPRDKIILWVLPTQPNMDLLTENSLPDPRVNWNRTSKLQLYINAMREVAITNGDYIADTTNIPDWKTYFIVDPVFPTQEGYRALVKHALAPAIKKIIKDRNRSKSKSFENDVKSAGYVLLEEVDELVFDITKFVISKEDIERYYSGYKIWVAKDYNEDWQVYRMYQNTGLITGAKINLDNRFDFIFDQDHEYQVNDLIFVRGFSDLFDGLFKVLAIEQRSVTVQGTDKTSLFLQFNDIDAQAVHFDFQSLRFSDIDQRDAAKPKHGWQYEDFIYIDDNGFGRWEVFKGELDRFSNIELVNTDVIYTEKYDITATACGDITVDNVKILNTAGINDQIHFNVSAFDDEDLYYSIEEVDEQQEAEIQIEKFFYLYLDRAPDSGTFNYYVDLVKSGQVNLSDVENSIKGSFEAISLGNRRRDFGNVATVIETVTVKSTIIWKFQSIRKETPLVDIDSVNNLYLYSNKQKRILARLDLYDPAKGRILGTANQDIDYTLSVDPAVYNKTATGSDTIGFSESYFWGPEVVGNYWWNIDNCRYIYYEYGSLDLRGRNWGKLFPGSMIEVFEWIESDVIPSVHVRLGLDGTPLYPDDSAYSEKVFVNESSSGFVSKYYFWVKNRSKKFNSSKTHSTAALKEIIESPLAQNIPYMAAIKQNAVALYNVGQFLNGNDTVLYVSSKRQLNDNIVHSDFALVQEGNVKSKWPEYLVEKLIDSISGIDQFNNSIPDQTLPIQRRFGIESFPRQSAIINQYRAKENVVKYVNSVLIKNQLANKAQNTKGNLYASQIPDPRWYDIKVGLFSSLEDPIPVNNQRILVLGDERNGFYWTIYQVVLLKTMQTTYVFDYEDFPRDYPLIRAVVSQLSPKRYDYFGYILIRRQGFDVTKYWYLTDWYASGYSKNTIVNHIALNNQDLYKIPLNNGDLVRVLNVSSSYNINVNYGVDLDYFQKTELYRYKNADGQLLGELVGLDSGTLQLSDDLYKQWGFDSERFDTLGFDYDTNKEFRYILKALKEEIFVDQLEIEWNRLLYYVMDIILGEQRYIDWFFKTSFISVNHNVNGLKQIPGYVKDRQQSFAEYINEVKPYRTKIREYKLTYNDIDLNRISVSDFDVPAVWDTQLEQFRSPNGEYTHDSILLQQPQYQDWKKNHSLYLESVNVISSGYNYQGIRSGSSAPPSVVVTRNDTNIGANARVSVSVSTFEPYGINQVTVSNTGGNFILTPSLTVINNGGDQLNDYLVYKFVVTSQGLSDTVGGTAGNVSFGLYSINDSNNSTTLFNTGTRSYTMHRIRRIDGKVVFTKSYDVFGTAGENKKLAQDLNNTSSDHIVVVQTYDEPQTNRLGNGLDLAMYRCGASPEVFGNTTDFQYRSAYILVGIAGSGQGQGIENYTGATSNSSNAYCRLEFNLFRSNLVPVEAFPRIYTLGTAASFPTRPTFGQTYSYGNKIWYWNGNTWIVSRRPLSSTFDFRLNPKGIDALVLAPRMNNDVTRKIKTTIRFDRIRFTSSVTDWTPGISYAVGDRVSYLNRAYEFKFDDIVPIGQNLNSFPFGLVKEITDHSIFDNANDRVMALYVSGAYNEYVPKLLNRLVSGLQTVSAITSEDNDPDTILIGDTFGSNAGISAGNIRVSGGTFVSEALTRSPEELVPGIVFDSLTIKVQESNGTSGFRFFKDINGNVTGTSYTTSSTTSLAQPVFLFSSNIEVADGTKLTAPVTVTSGNAIVSVTPGVILVNGERIAYYVKSGNTLQQIRRGYQGTGTPSLHLTGSLVEDVSTARSSNNYLTDFTKPVPPTPTGSWSVTSVTPTALGGNTFVFNYTTPSNAPGNVTVSWFAVNPGNITLFSNTGIIGANNLGYPYNLPITSTSGTFQINTVPIFGDTQVFEVILTEGSIVANLLARSGTSNITTNVITSNVVTGIQFVPGYYYEREYANQYAGLWSQGKTYQMESVTGLGSVNMHGPTPGSYILNLNNLPPHDEKKVSFIMHFVDSLDAETSTITIGNVVFAEFTKTGFPGAGTPGAPVYTINSFAVSDWYPANYSYQPWGSGSTKNGYVVFESNWIASNSSSFSANIYLGHDQPQTDEAIYFSHFNLRLQGGNAVVIPSLPMPTLNFTFSNLTVPSGYTLVSNTFTTSNTVTIPDGVTRIQITGRGQDGVASNLNWQSTWITGDPLTGPAFATVTDTSIAGVPSSIIESDSQSQFNSLPDTRVSTGSNISFIHRTYNNQTLTETTYVSRVRLKTGVSKLKSGSGWGSTFTTPSIDTKVYGVLSSQYEEYRGGSNGADASVASVILPGGRNGLVAPLTATSLAVTPGVTYPVTVPTGGIVNVQYVKPNVIVVPDTNPFKAKVFNSPGTFTWTAPTGVTKIHVLCVGGGGGGSYSGFGDAGGGGGGLGWKNFISVTPGSSYTVVVGAGGGNVSGIGLNGGASYFINMTTVAGGGGYGGGQVMLNARGGSYVGQGGGYGGNGGITGGGGRGAGGGGAGGYEGNGGAGGSYLNDGTSGSGGGGGGGAGEDGTYNFGGGAGGGVSFRGKGSDGAGGEYGSTTSRNGGGGSEGATSTTTYNGGADGAKYGGGGGSGSSAIPGANLGGRGGDGVVVIYYGPSVENLSSSLPDINMTPLYLVLV